MVWDEFHHLRQFIHAGKDTVIAIVLYSVVYYITMVVSDDLEFGTLCGNLSKKMIYCDDHFIACS